MAARIGKQILELHGSYWLVVAYSYRLGLWKIWQWSPLFEIGRLSPAG